MKTCVKEELLQSIGRQLRKLKINNDCTTKEIAAVLNITPQAYGNIERGESASVADKAPGQANLPKSLPFSSQVW